MAPPPGKVKCTFADCYLLFKTIKDMKRHKEYADEHDYCRICNEDFEDWDSWSRHNAHWSGKDLFGKMKADYEKERKEKTKEGKSVFAVKKEEMISSLGEEAEKYGALKHHDWGCKFCGELFKSEGGREHHLNQYHPVDQNIKCPGCPKVFPRASGLIFHFEKGYCSTISAARFKGYLQHKGVVARLLEDPSMMEQMTRKDCSEFQDAAKDTEEGGGVNIPDLLNDDDDKTIGEASLMEPLVPDSTSSATMLAEQQKWPIVTTARRAPTQASVELTENMGKLSVKYGVPLSTQPQEQQVDANPWPLPQDYKMKDKLPQKPVPWASGATSKSLFPGARATPPAADWEHRLKEKEEKDHKSNFLHLQFWNPTHEDYDAERFYDPMTEKYKCPFPGCNQAFGTPVDNKAHITAEHAVQSVRCPSCLKIFKTYTGLVSHCESPVSRCNLSRSQKFGQAVDLFSGGFLAASVTARPDITEEEDGSAIGYMKFEATVPYDYENIKGTVIGKKWD